MNIKLSGLIFLLIPVMTMQVKADWSTVKSSAVQISVPPDSATTETELLTLHNFEKTRTEMDCNLASSQALPSFDRFFVNKLHPVLTPDEAGVLKDFVTKAMNVASNITNAYKNKYSRPRPLAQDNTLKPCLTTPSGNLSYPSAHSAMAIAGACAIGKVLTNQAGEVLQYANYIAELRAVVGVHHPSDVIAGKSIGTQLCDLWTRDNSFEAEVSQLRKALKLQ